MSLTGSHVAYGLLRLPNDVAHNAFLHYVGIPNVGDPSSTETEESHYLLFVDTFFRFSSLNSPNDVLAATSSRFLYSTILVPFCAYSTHINLKLLEGVLSRFNTLYKYTLRRGTRRSRSNSPPPSPPSVWLVGIRSGVLGRKFLGDKLTEASMREHLQRLEQAKIVQVKSMLQKWKRDMKSAAAAAAVSEEDGVGVGVAGGVNVRLHIVEGNRQGTLRGSRSEDAVARRAFFECMETILAESKKQKENGMQQMKQLQLLQSSKVRAPPTRQRKRPIQAIQGIQGGGGEISRPRRPSASDIAAEVHRRAIGDPPQGLLGRRKGVRRRGRKKRHRREKVPGGRGGRGKGAGIEKESLVSKLQLMRKAKGMLSEGSAASASASAAGSSSSAVPKRQSSAPVSEREREREGPKVDPDDEFDVLIDRMVKRFDFVGTLDTDVRKRSALVLNRFQDLRGKRKGDLDSLFATSKQTLDSGVRVLGKLDMAVSRLGDEKIFGLFKMLEKVVAMRTQYLEEFAGMQKNVREEVELLRGAMVTPDDGRVQEYARMYSSLRERKKDLIEVKILMNLGRSLGHGDQDLHQLHALEAEIESMTARLQKMSQHLMSSCRSLGSYRTAVDDHLSEIRKRTTSHLLHLCPLSKQRLSDPVVLIESGTTYERSAIVEWLRSNDVDPISKKPLSDKSLVDNVNLRNYLKQIEEMKRDEEDEEEEEEEESERGSVRVSVDSSDQ